MTYKSVLIAGVAFLAASVSFAQTDEEEQPAVGPDITITEALTSGETHLLFRYRYEFVDDGRYDENANASTLRVRLNYLTGSWRNWSGFGEFDYTATLLFDEYNSGAGTSSDDRDQYPVVADPRGADLNQLYLDYKGLTDTRLRLGRQRINLDNQRFIGGVGWRQNEQTFDAFSAAMDAVKNSNVFFAYVTQVNRIFGERSPAGKANVDMGLLNWRWSINDDWQLVPYAYYVDDKDNLAFSTSTFGIRTTGKIALANSSLSLVAELATQSDAADNPVNYDANYVHASANWQLKNGWGFWAGLESLGGDDTVAGSAFRTPFATLHKFQGWADQFLVTPGAGVDDVYVGAKYALNKWTFQGIYHDFSANDGSAHWGSEIDIAASRKLGDRYALLLKGAFFDADDAPYVDVTKFWIQLVANF